MKYVFLSRNQNRFGFNILNLLIKKNFLPECLIVHKKNFFLDNLIFNYFIRFFYGLIRFYYNSKKLHFLESEILLAKKNKISIKTLNNYNEYKILEYLKKEKIKLIFIGGGWPTFINEKFLRLKNVKIVNLHPSYLPSFKGTSVTRWQKFYNPREIGATLHYLSNNYDSGKIILRKKIAHDFNLTPQELFNKLVQPAKLIT